MRPKDIEFVASSLSIVTYKLDPFIESYYYYKMMEKTLRSSKGQEIHSLVTNKRMKWQYVTDFVLSLFLTLS